MFIAWRMHGVTARHMLASHRINAHSSEARLTANTTATIVHMTSAHGNNLPMCSSHEDTLFQRSGRVTFTARCTLVQ